jgi:xylulokinase
MCFDISSKDWSAEMMEVAQINPSKFSTPVKSGTVVGTVKPGIAFELGLSTQTKVVTGAHDQVCASLGAGVLSPGLSLDGTGTVECIATAVNRPYIGESLKKCGYACGPHAIANMYLIYALSFTGGALLKWYRDTFTKHEFDMSKLSDGNIYQQLDAEAGTIPSSLLVLPYFAGACTPYMDESAKGAILGLTLETTKIDIYRALMESVVYEMLLNIEILKKFGIAVKELRATGGGASSPFWLQMKADILEIPVMSFYNCEVANIGAVMLAGVATGKYLNLQEASSALVKTGKTYEPNMGNRSRYREKYSCYKRMYDAVKQVYGEDH